MKRWIIASVLLAAFSLVLPLTRALEAEPSREREAAPVTYGSLWYSPAAAEYRRDAETTLTLLDGGEAVTINMEDYLFGAVAAEMPASFDLEALKAQAVALRTYALYKMTVEPTDKHEADICSDSSCCAAWKSEAYLREKWGDDYDAYAAIIRSAVSATDGEYIAYENAPALAVFHASSDGKTEDSGAVWGRSLPYLVSVDTPETAENVRNFAAEVFISREELNEKLTGAKSGAELISGAEYTEAGRLARVTLCGVSLTGREMRSLFGLNSTAIELSEAEDGILITTYGRGHGVGMSQFGADLMAKDGADYREILATYYPGTELVSP